MADRYWVASNPPDFFSLSGQVGDPRDIFFKPDGTKMYVLGGAADDVNQFDLSVAWEIETAAFVHTFSIANQETLPEGIFFSSDGTRMYVIGRSGDDVNQYALSVAWDISTASYSKVFSISGQEANPTGIFFKPDGTKMYITGTSGDDVNEYDLSTAWDVATASYLQNFSVSAEELAPQALQFSTDGTKMYIAGTAGDDVNEYSLSTAWDISTAVFVQNFSTSFLDTIVYGIFFKSDGTKLYMSGVVTNAIWGLNLTTPWDLSSVSVDVWNGVAGAKWAATSGGAGGESTPTSSDNVFLDSNSVGNVFIVSGNTGAASLDCTGFTDKLFLLSGITVSGNLTFVPGMSFLRYGSVTVVIAGTGTVTSAGHSFTNFTVSATGGTVTLADALTATGTFNLSFGTFDTAGYNLSCNILTSANTNVRGLNLNSSVVTLTTELDFSTSTNLSFNAGTSSIVCINFNGAGRFEGGAQTFYDVTFQNTIPRISEIGQSNTFNDLILSSSGLGLCGVYITSNQTVNGSLICSSSAANSRSYIASDAVATSRTITAASASIADCDFRDITISGGAVPVTGTNCGDFGGNSGITFPAGKTVYRVGADTTWGGVSSWATTSGGVGSDANFPLAQDTAVFDENVTATDPIVIPLYGISGIDCSARTTALVLNFSADVSIFGSLTLSSGASTSGGAGRFVTFARRSGTMVYTSAGKALGFSLRVNAPGGELKLNDAITAPTNSYIMYLDRGTLDANDYNVTVGSFQSAGTAARTVNLGDGTWTITSGVNPWNMNSSGLTLNAEGSTVRLASSGTQTFAGGSKSYNKVIFGAGNNTTTITVTGTNSFAELASLSNRTSTVLFAANQGTIGTWSYGGNPGYVTSIRSSSAGQRRSFNLTNVTTGIDYLTVKDIGVVQTDTFYVGANSINGGNNLNVIFTDPPSDATGSFFMLFN